MSAAVTVPPRGMTLIECLAGMTVAAVLTAAAGALLLAGLRFARHEAATLAVRHSVRTGAAVLRAELSALSAEAGDLIALSDSAVTMRALRGFGVLCARPSGSRIVLDDSLRSAWRALDPARDSARFLVEGDPRTARDDRWALAAIAGTGRGPCASGVAGTAITLDATAAADLAAADAGAPVRIFEVVQYRRYRDGAGLTMLGVRSPRPGGGWAATSPVAGPLRATGGLVLEALTATGVPAGAPDEAVLVTFTLRAAGVVTLPDGRRPGLRPRTARAG